MHPLASPSAGVVGVKLAPYTPSADDVVVFAAELLQLDKSDVLFDLGCGDARMLIHAAKHIGVRCVSLLACPH